jgi:hypothetical protein
MGLYWNQIDLCLLSTKYYLAEQTLSEMRTRVLPTISFDQGGPLISLPEPNGRILGTLRQPTSESTACAMAEPESYDKNFVSRLVVYESEKRLFLGIAEETWYPEHMDRQQVKIRNLLCLGRDSSLNPGGALEVRQAPGRIGQAKTETFRVMRPLRL